MDSKIVNQWEQISEIPEIFGPDYHTMVAYQDSLYLFCGYNHPNCEKNLVCFDIKKKSWSIVATTGEHPSLKYGYSTVIYKSSMFVSGEHTSNNGHNLLEYKFRTKEWTQCYVSAGDKMPRQRSRHGTVVYGDRLWIFYGYYNGNQLTNMWNISLLSGSPKQWKEINQIGDRPTRINQCAVTVASNYMFALGERNDIKSIFRFNFEEGKWLCLKNMPKLNLDYNLVAYEDQLFILSTDPELYSFNLDTKILSVIKFTGPNPLDNKSLLPAVVIRDAIYICNKDGRLFKYQLAPNYSKICTLRADYNKVFEQQFLCDVEFVVGEEQVSIPAHIPIVVARSHWLRDSIRQLRDSNVTIKDSALLQVKLPNVDPDIFQMVLSYLYTDQIKPSKENILLNLDFYNLAREMGLERLQQLITKLFTKTNLKACINLSNVLDVLLKANLLKLLPVKEFCLNFVMEDSNCKIMRSKKFITLDSNLLEEIIEKKQITFSETGANSQPDTDTSNLSLKADMKVFMETIGEEFSDITLMFGEDRILAHKCILAARSSYFEAMFRSFTPPDNTVQIQIDDIIRSRDAFDFLLKYIYYDEINLPLNDVPQLIAAPSYYGFTNNKRLFEILKINLKEFGTVENIVKILKAADKFQADEITNYILNTFFS